MEDELFKEMMEDLGQVWRELDPNDYQINSKQWGIFVEVCEAMQHIANRHGGILQDIHINNKTTSQYVQIKFGTNIQFTSDDVEIIQKLTGIATNVAFGSYDSDNNITFSVTIPDVLKMKDEI